MGHVASGRDRAAGVQGPDGRFDGEASVGRLEGAAEAAVQLRPAGFGESDRHRVPHDGVLEPVPTGLLVDLLQQARFDATVELGDQLIDVVIDHGLEQGHRERVAGDGAGPQGLASAVLESV